MGTAHDPTVLTQIIADRTRNRGAQTALAHQLGVKVQTVNKWVKGQTTPDPSRWPDIETALGLPDGHLATAVGLDTAPSAVDRLDRLEARVDRLETLLVARDSDLVLAAGGGDTAAVKRELSATEPAGRRGTSNVRKDRT